MGVTENRKDTSDHEAVPSTLKEMFFVQSKFDIGNPFHVSIQL